MSKMFFDLNVPIPNLYQPTTTAPTKKGKGKQQSNNDQVKFTPAQITAIETRIDLLVRCMFRI
jgi:ribonuclease P/MRP protein subunit RPP1